MKVKKIKYTVICACGCVFTETGGMIFTCPICGISEPMEWCEWPNPEEEERKKQK